MFQYLLSPTSIFNLGLQKTRSYKELLESKALLVGAQHNMSRLGVVS
jgi:hypothetical protein